jgi:hypothetical protein
VVEPFKPISTFNAMVKKLKGNAALKQVEKTDKFCSFCLFESHVKGIVNMME